jgi:hypothetical protein
MNKIRFIYRLFLIAFLRARTEKTIGPLSISVQSFSPFLYAIIAFLALFYGVDLFKINNIIILNPILNKIFINYILATAKVYRIIDDKLIMVSVEKDDILYPEVCATVFGFNYEIILYIDEAQLKAGYSKKIKEILLKI